MKTLFSEIIDARNDASPALETVEWQVRRFQGYLYLIPNNLPVFPKEIDVHADSINSGKIDLPYPVGSLEFVISDLSLMDDQKMTVRFRSEGDEVKLDKRNGTKKLKKLLQEWLVPPWMRDYVPMLYLGDECIAIADYAVCESEHGKVFENIQWYPVKELDWRLNHDKPPA